MPALFSFSFLSLLFILAEWVSFDLLNLKSIHCKWMNYFFVWNISKMSHNLNKTHMNFVSQSKAKQKKNKNKQTNKQTNKQNKKTKTKQKQTNKQTKNKQTNKNKNFNSPRGGVFCTKDPDRDVPPTWIVICKFGIWVDFSKCSQIWAKIGSKLRKFWKNRMSLLKIWP